MGNFKVYTAFNKHLGQTAHAAQKLNFELTENLNPLQGLTHTLTPSSIQKYVWIYHGMHCTPRERSKLSVTLKNKDLAT